MSMPTLLYLIAHAPSEPWAWFKPTMPTEKPKPRWVDEDGKTYATWHQAEKAVGEDGFCDKNDQAAREWDSEYARQRDIQWPKFWADTMIKTIP